MKYPTNFGLLLVHFILLLQQHAQTKTALRTKDLILKLERRSLGGPPNFWTNKNKCVFNKTLNQGLRQLFLTTVSWDRYT